MPLDGIYLNTIVNEIKLKTLNNRVEKIYQPTKDEIVIALRGYNGVNRLYVSANASSPRVNFTNVQIENPQKPPMFCMLLRKHLNSAKLVNVRQHGLDRVMILDFETINELGDNVIMSIVIEIMGKYSNIILMNSDNKIIDSIKRVTNEVSSVRIILPGSIYELPPKQDKLNLLAVDADKISEKMFSLKPQDTAKALLNSIEGFSPLIAREVAYIALDGKELMTDSLSAFYKDKIKAELESLKEKIENNDCSYTVVKNEKQKIYDFSCVDLTQYGGAVEKTTYTSPSELLDNFFASRDRETRMKQRSHDLLRLLLNNTERISKKILLQEKELEDCKNRDYFKMCGDLLNSNLYRLEKGIASVKLENYYDEDMAEIEIKLDPRLTPSQNAQKYYNEYRKMITAEKMLNELIEKSKEELIYLDSVFDAVSRTDGESELLEIREELVEQGYLKHQKRKKDTLKPQPPMKFISSDGFTILCGRNNKQNDKLTLKTAKNYDMWLHTQGIAGSHTVIVSDNREITDNAITEAAIIAAYNSNAQSSQSVPVDYTLIRNVKKPSGAKPGMVIFTDYKTAYVTPDENLVNSLRVK